MKLVLYSGGYAGQNRHIDDILLQQTGKKPERVRMTFIPSSSWRLREQFAEFFGDFRRFGVRSTFCLPVDTKVNKNDLDTALRSDIIYLGGGNTFYFLKHLRETGLFQRLKKYAKEERGVLAGLSAGAIVMTPSINMAAIPKRTADSNEIKLKDRKAMGLVRFEFHAHHTNKRWENLELKRYSAKLSYPLYTCPDGSGILVRDESLSFLGGAHAFVKGQLFRDLDSAFPSIIVKR